jgi:hypothetical protein
MRRLLPLVLLAAGGCRGPAPGAEPSAAPATVSASAESTASEPALAAPVAAGEATPAPLTIESVPGASSPAVATAADGAALLVAVEPGPEARRVRLFRRAPGEPGFVRWGEVAVAPDIAKNGADTPQIAVAGDTVFVSFPVSFGREATLPKLAISRDGGRTFAAPVALADDRSATEHGFVSLLSREGGVLACWLDGRAYATAAPDETALRCRTVGADGALGPEREVDARVCDCCPTAAVDTATGVLLAFRDRGADDVRDVTIVEGDSGRVRPVPADGWKIAGCPVAGPALAVNGDAVLAATFSEISGGPVASVRLSADGGLSFPTSVPFASGPGAGRIAATALPGGDFAVAAYDGEPARLVLRRVRARAVLGDAVDVAPIPAVRGAGIPRLSLASDGLLAVWTEPGESGGLRAAKVDPASL